VSEGFPLSPAKRALLERALLRRRQAERAKVTIPRRPDVRPAPLSFSQQRMWFLEQWEPGSPTFNGARALRLRGPLNSDALERSLRTIVERHESLRTVVVPGERPTQALLDAAAFRLELEAGDEPGLPDRLRELSRRPFDLTADLMLRATLIALGAEENVLLLGMHHIAADAHSDSILFAELAELYEAELSGVEPVLATLPIQYADYAVWQHERLRGSVLEELRSYWAETLEGAPELLRLPTDRPRPPVQRHNGAHHRISLERRLADELIALAQAESATFFMAMLAAFGTLLYRIGGEQDIVLGSPIANRNNVELQGLIGFFTNTIALRVQLGGNPSFREVLRRARAAALGAYAHQELPFEKVVEAVAPRRDPGYNPLFQVNFRAQATERPPLRLAGIEVEPVAVDVGFSRFDLALEVEAAAGSLRGYFEYDKDLFDRSTVLGFEQNLRTLLEQVVENPETPILALALSSRKAAGHSIRRRSSR
jgi:condensation domain-containing protein